MARTKQTAQKSTGGKSPLKQLSAKSLARKTMVYILSCILKVSESVFSPPLVVSRSPIASDLELWHFVKFVSTKGRLSSLSASSLSNDLFVKSPRLSSSDGQVRFWTVVRTWTPLNRTWSSVQGSQKWLNRTSGPVQGSTTGAMVRTGSNHECLEDKNVVEGQQNLDFRQCKVCYSSFGKVIYPYLSLKAP